MTYKRENLVDLTRRVYSLTLLFPKKEPLRYKIRELADEILAQTISCRYENSKKDDPKDLLKNLEILDSFFEVARAQNWISPTEIFGIQKEYQNLKKEITEKESLTFEFDPPFTQHPVINSTLGKLDTAQTLTELNERQKKILEILKEKEKIQVWQIKEIFPQVSKRTLRRDFQDLYKKGIIERVGEKTNTFYKLS